MNNDDNGQAFKTIGALLSAERQKRDIPIERAAKETRMRVQRIRDMENDDLSNFSNPSYARMFAIAYAKYLGVPMQKVRELLPERAETGTEGYGYIGASDDAYPSLRPNLVTRRQRNLFVPTVITIVLGILVIGGGAIAYYIVVNLPRLASDSSPAQSQANRPLLSAEDELRKSNTNSNFEVVPAEIMTAGSAEAAPVTNERQLDQVIDFSSTSELPSDDLDSDDAASLRESIPAPEADPAPPDLPIDQSTEADRAFLLQEP